MTAIQQGPRPGSPEYQLQALANRLRQPTWAQAIQQANRTGADPKFIIELALSQVRANPKLAACRPETILNAIREAVGLGLEPCSARGLAFLIPYKDQCRFQPGYKGLLMLAYKADQVSAISTASVYTHDHFKLYLGTEQRVEHSPNPRDRGEFMGAYAIAHMKGGGKVVVYLNKGEIDEVMETSQAVKFKKMDSPWYTHYPRMAEKTTLIRLCKLIPSSAELQRALVANEYSEGQREDYEPQYGATEGEFIDVEPKQEDPEPQTSAPSGSKKKETGGKKDALSAVKADVAHEFQRLVLLHPGGAEYAIQVLASAGFESLADALGCADRSALLGAHRDLKEKADAVSPSTEAKGQLFNNPKGGPIEP